MAGFYIKKVIAKSIAKGDASITFGKGLTIIQGRSDSGKTCVAYLSVTIPVPCCFYHNCSVV